MISFGGVMGKTSALQLLCMAFIEVFFYGLNTMVCFNYLLAVDAGGSMVIHAFGAYFGLACSWMLS